jgi:hypothetical protein
VSTCEHCGSNLYFAQNFPRVRDKAQYLQRELEKALALLAKEQAERKLERWERENEKSWLQQKVHRQTKVLEKFQREATPPSRQDTQPQPAD